MNPHRYELSKMVLPRAYESGVVSLSEVEGVMFWFRLSQPKKFHVAISFVVARFVSKKISEGIFAYPQDGNQLSATGSLTSTDDRLSSQLPIAVARQ